MKTANARQIALNILNRFYANKFYIEKLIDEVFTQNELSNQDKSFINELIYGVIRWQIKIDYILNLYLTKDISTLHPTIKNIMRLALYQLLFLDKVPNFATVNESVNLAKSNKLQLLANFVNATLRSIISNKKELNLDKNNVNYYFSIEYSHPQWLVERLISQFGIEETELILQNNNQRAKTTIRVNLAKSSIGEVEDFLQENQINFTKNELFPNCFVLDKSKFNITNSNFFREGKITVQDLSAILCASLTVPKFNDLIFDLCASPGGKTCYISELMNKNQISNELNQGKIIANDLFSDKIKLIKKNAKRLNCKNIEYVCGNALDFDYKEKADIILLDVPCSGIGTISKKPDIKHFRKEKDFKDLIEIQRKLLLKANDLLKIGGILVYSTCSIDKEENIGNIDWFLQNNNQFSVDEADKYVNKSYCKDKFVQFFPHKSISNFRFDGAFAARLIKNY